MSVKKNKCESEKSWQSDELFGKYKFEEHAVVAGSVHQ